MKRARKAWLQLHRWVGLSAALVLVVAGLSGSFLAYYTEIDRWLNPDWVTTTPGGTALPMQEVLGRAAPVLDGWFLHSVFPPQDPEDVHHVWFTPGPEDYSRMWEVLVDPYSGKVLGSREAVPTIDFSRRNIANTIYTLHFQLFMGDVGGKIVGFAGVFLLFSTISGVVLWWPQGGNWRIHLALKRGASSIRRHYDLHRVSGIYGAVFLAVIAFTGAMIALAEYVEPVVEQVVPRTPEPTLQVQGSDAEGGTGADAVMEVAHRLVPGARVTCLWLPGASGEAWRVTMREPAGVGLAGGPADVWVHPGTGEVLAVHRYGAASDGDVFWAWLLPLHGGSALGSAGRIIAFCAGLLPLVMAITGFSIWLRKRRGQKA